MFKIRYAVLLILVLLSVSAASAQTAAAPAQDHASIAAPPFNPSSNLVQDPGDEGCGEIDPSKPCYSSGGTTDACVKATSYASCKSKCECEYKKNKKKCNMSPQCIEIATSERDACLGNCMVDRE